MKIKKCIIPIAGRGTRRLPITKTVSKEMLPIINKPSIMLIVEECLKSGIEEIIFVLNESNFTLIEDFFSPNDNLNNFLENCSKKDLLKDLEEIISKIKFHYVLQDENIRGTAGAVYAARKYLNDEYFGVVFGDDLIDSKTPCLKNLIEECEKYDCNVLGVREVPENLKYYYYVIKYKKDNIMDCFAKKEEEKELASNHMMVGRLVLHSTIIDKILECQCHDDKEYFLPDVLEKINEEVRTIKCDGDYYNIGNKDSYIKANIAYYLKNNNGEDLLDFIKNKMNK